MSQVSIPTSNCGAWKFALCLTITSAVFDVLVKLAIHILPWLTVKPRESNRVLWHWSCISLWQIDVVGTGRNGNSLKRLWWCWCLCIFVLFCQSNSYMNHTCNLYTCSWKTQALAPSTSNTAIIGNDWHLLSNWIKPQLVSFLSILSQERKRDRKQLWKGTWQRHHDQGLAYVTMHTWWEQKTYIRFSGSGTGPNKMVFYCHLSFSSKALQPLACVFPRKWNAPNRRQLISNDTPVLF